jgi:hypothetical protein
MNLYLKYKPIGIENIFPWQVAVSCFKRRWFGFLESHFIDQSTVKPTTATKKGDL